VDSTSFIAWNRRSLNRVWLVLEVAEGAAVQPSEPRLPGTISRSQLAHQSPHPTTLTSSPPPSYIFFSIALFHKTRQVEIANEEEIQASSLKTDGLMISKAETDVVGSAKKQEQGSEIGRSASPTIQRTISHPPIVLNAKSFD